MERIHSRQQKIFTFGTETIREQLYINFKEVIELSWVERIYKNDAIDEIPNSVLESLRMKILESNLIHKDLMLKEASKRLIIARSECGLEPIPTTIHGQEKGIQDEILLYHPTSLWYNAQSFGSLNTFSRILSIMFLANSRTYSVSPKIGLSKCTPAPKQQLLIADKLDRLLASGADGILDVESGYFICLCCRPLLRSLTSWPQLVRKGWSVKQVHHNLAL